MREKRAKERRRGFDSGRSFPFTDSAGQLVPDDRRRMPDRRLNSISLTLKRLESINGRSPGHPPDTVERGT